MATLHLIRGLPGSGKSTFAKKLAEQLGCLHFETDMFFTDKNGNYNFVREKLGEAHEWCRNSVLDEITRGNDVVVSNTFTTEREVRAYMSDDHPIVNMLLGMIKFPVVVYEMTEQYGNIHEVPELALNAMAARWVNNSDLAKLKWNQPIEFKTLP